MAETDPSLQAQRVAFIKKRLYAYCAYQDRCRQELEQKLEDLEVPSDDWEDWLAHLEAERFWDEQRFVTSFVRGKFFYKHWGRLRLQQELRRRNIPEAMIGATIAREIPEADYQAGLQVLIERKWREYRQQNRQKLIRFLLQKGYRWDEFRDLLPEESGE